MGDIMIEMSELGYPKTALPFDIFSDNMGFTTTEFEKRQYLLMNLQDRLERTLKDMTGIKNAIVTLNGRMRALMYGRTRIPAVQFCLSDFNAFL